MIHKTLLLIITLLSVITVICTGQSLPASSTPDYTTMSTATPIPVNIAVGKPLYASSQYSNDFPASYVNDADLTTVWGSQVSSKAQWIYIDLLENQTFNGLNLHWFDKYYPEVYHIYFSDDAVTWTLVSKIKKTVQGPDLFTGEGMTRYIGIVCMRNPHSVYGLAEMEVIQNIPVTPTPPAFGGIEGHVYAYDSTLPVVGATITLGTGMVATTNASGYYALSTIPTGDYTITVHADNYGTAYRDIHINPDEFTRENLSLIHLTSTQFHSTNPLPVVLAGQRGRLIFPPGIFLDMHDLTYDGDVTVHSSALTIQAPDFIDTFPAGFTGIADGGQPVHIAAYAVGTTALTDVNALELHLPAGKGATLSVDLGSADLTGVDLWYYDTTINQWTPAVNSEVIHSQGTSYQTTIDRMGTWAMAINLNNEPFSTATVSGNVVDLDGIGVGGATVTCRTSDLQGGVSEFTGITDRRGRFTIPVTINGDTSYWIKATKDNRESTEQPIIVSDTGTPLITLTLDTIQIPTPTATPTSIPTATPDVTKFTVVKDGINRSISYEDIFIRDTYLFAAVGYSGLKIFDVGNPADPVELSHVDTPGYAYDVYISDNYAYVADGTADLHIIDISNIQNASIATTVTMPGHAYGVFASGNYAYVAADTHGLQIINISDVNSAYIENTIGTTGDTRNVYVSGNYAYLADGYNGLQIIDITTASIINTIDTSFYAYDVYISGNYAYVSDSYEGLVIIDISNVQTASIVKTVKTHDNVRDVYVSGNYAYLADDTAGMQIIDVSSPQTASLVNTVPTSGSAWGVGVFGDYAYVADGTTGLQVITISDVLNPLMVNTVNKSGGSRGVAVAGTYVLVADGSAGLQIIDGTNRSIVNTVVTPGLAWDVSVFGNYAYVADSNAGLQIIDITTASIVNTVPISGLASDVCVSDNYVFVGSNTGLHIIDIRTLQVIRTLSTTGPVESISVAGDYVYLTDGGPDLQIIDITTIQTASIVKTVKTSGTANDVHVYGNYAFVAIERAYLDIIDITDIQTASVINRIKTTGLSKGVHVSGNYAFVANNYYSIQIIDISNVHSLKNVKTVNTYIYADSMQSDDQYLYVANKHEGLIIIGEN